MTELVMTLDKVTKGAARYRCVGGNGLPPQIKTVYVEKWALLDDAGNVPATITVAVELGEDRIEAITPE